MITAITYSTKEYDSAKKYNMRMAQIKGKADTFHGYDDRDLDPVFRAKNERILSSKRGAGYWLWKPYIVNKVLQEINDGDYLLYCDSGAFFKKDVHLLTEFMEKKKTDLLCFELNLKEANWTKRDVFIALECDEEKYYNTNQRCATYFCIKKTERTHKFVKEWLEYAQKYELISDEDNVLFHKENFEGFVENRHDQSIFSLLTKKYGYTGIADISQYRYPIGFKQRIRGKRQNKEYEVPVMVCLHRQKKANMWTDLEETIISFFPRTKRYLHYFK